MPRIPSLAHATRLATLVLRLGLCSFVLSLFVAGEPGLNTGPLRIAPAPQMIGGTAERPYALRALVPVAVRGLVGVVPRATRDRLSTELHAGNEHVRRLTAHFEIQPTFLPEFAAIVALLFAALYGFMIAVRRLFDELFEGPRHAPEMAAALSVLLLPPFFAHGGHFLYDLPVPFFVAAALAFLARRRWAPYYGALALGFVNKETMCLVAIPFAVHLWDRLPRREWATHLGAHVLLFAGLRLLVLLLFDPDRPTAAGGGFVRDYFAYNLLHAWQSRLLYDWVSLAALVGIALLVLRGFGRRPHLLRAASLMVFPLAAGFLAGGMWREIRVFYEVFPVFFLLGFASALECLGVTLRVRDEQAGPALLANEAAARWAWIGAAAGFGLLMLLVLFHGLARKFA